MGAPVQQPAPSAHRAEGARDGWNLRVSYQAASLGRAFSSEVDTGSREDIATTQRERAFSVIQGSWKML
jgi:hypothetical protein